MKNNLDLTLEKLEAQEAPMEMTHEQELLLLMILVAWAIT